MLTEKLLKERAERCMNKGFPKQKWIEFCEAMLEKGYKLHLYEARRTVSKYITVIKGKKRFKVRFSNHKPILQREALGDCNFFVGVTNFKVTTTQMAIQAVEDFFNNQLDS
jgi:hypothetical protein